MSVSQRIKTLSKEFGGIKKFSEKCNIVAGTLRSMISRDGELRSDTLALIINALPNLNLRWLILGEGEMWMSKYRQFGDLSSQELNESNDKHINRLIDLLEKRVKLLEQELKEADPELAKKHGIE